MSRTGPPATEPAVSTAVGPHAAAVWRRSRWWLSVLLAVLAASAVIGLVSSTGTRGELDPADSGPTGSRALAALLADRGVRVVRATSVSAALRGAGPRRTLLVPFPDRVSADQLDRLATAYAGDRLVLVAPSHRELAAVHADPVPRGTAPVARRDPDCDLPVAATAGDADLGGRAYDPAGGTGCYPAAQGSTLVVARRAGGGRLVVLGAGDPLENGLLDRHGNAALGLLLLGVAGTPGGPDGAGGPPAEQVVWLVSGPGSAAASTPPSLVDVAPRWLLLGLAQALLAGLVVAVWRGRRLGPPVVEPLPVVVRAAETVEGRARLYRRAGARDRAAEALRAGALARLASRLGHQGPGDSPPSVTAAAVAARLAAGAGPAGHPTGYGAGLDAKAVLLGPPPRDDAGLVRLADQLDAVVAATLATPTPHRTAVVSDLEDGRR